MIYMFDRDFRERDNIIDDAKFELPPGTNVPLLSFGYGEYTVILEPKRELG